MTPDQFEERLAQFLFERSEEARAVRVGEKETSEQAAIVARYEDLFTREQYAELKAAEDRPLRETFASGFSGFERPVAAG